MINDLLLDAHGAPHHETRLKDDEAHVPLAHFDARQMNAAQADLPQVLVLRGVQIPHVHFLQPHLCSLHLVWILTSTAHAATSLCRDVDHDPQ
jgi:hypothetical protein